MNRDSHGKIDSVAVDGMPVLNNVASLEEPSSTGRFRNSTTENMNGDGHQFNHANEICDSQQMTGSGQPSKPRKQVIKIKKNPMSTALERALQSTQYEGLKILTKDSILDAQKTLNHRKGSNKDEIKKIIPTLKLNNEQEGEEDVQAQQMDSQEETVSRFMVELGHWLQD